jgi:ATP-binding cassette subfamily E protein 1
MDGKDNKFEKSSRLAILNPEKCKPKKCGLECKRYCPVNRTGKVCVEAERNMVHAKISELTCIGCNICVKKCPFGAIKIINLPKNLPNAVSHRYGENRFVLYKLPTPRLTGILGLVGTNGIGKTTALQILTKKIVPNLGRFDNPPDWDEIIQSYKGSEIQNYFEKLVKEDYKSAFKVQFVDKIPKIVKGNVGDILDKKNQRPEYFEELVKLLELDHLLKRPVSKLSGGELQRFTILLTLLQKVNIYIFDEPTSYLDVKQRLTISKAIRKYTSFQEENNYRILVEHDLSILDFMSDYICCLFGKPSAYGVVSLPYSVKEGINVFLDGFLPKENIRFRDYGLDFKGGADGEFSEKEQEKLETEKEKDVFDYPDMSKKFPGFELEIEKGSFSTSQIIVLLGENGTGKTTFVRILAGRDTEVNSGLKLAMSYKPQSISPKFEGTVSMLMYERLKGIWTTNMIYKQNIFDPMMVQKLFNYEVKKLSGGEMQRVGIAVAFGKKADVYLIDEPSAYLDVEQRIVTAKCIKKFILLLHKTAFVVEHDFIMATYLADRFIVYEGEPGKKCKANSPSSITEGMNKFLNLLGITFRRDGSNLRPRINKLDSNLDKTQKASGNYFFVDNN